MDYPECTTLHILGNGSFIQSRTRYVQYYMGRKYYMYRIITAHASGGSYLEQLAMIQHGHSFRTIPGSGKRRNLARLGTFTAHLPSIQEVHFHTDDGTITRFLSAPF